MDHDHSTRYIRVRQIQAVIGIKGDFSLSAIAGYVERV